MSESNKKQGESVGNNQESDTLFKALPEHLDRGIGSAYAQAVGNLINEAKGIKGSTHGFLGHEKQTIDAKQFAHYLNKPDKK